MDGWWKTGRPQNSRLCPTVPSPAGWLQLVRPRWHHDAVTRMWTPDPERARGARINALRDRFGAADFETLHARSIDAPGEFWRAVWDTCGVVGEPGSVAFDPGDGTMRGARFFTEARLNFAE